VKYWKTDDNLPEQDVIDVGSDNFDDELPEADTEDV